MKASELLGHWVDRHPSAVAIQRMGPPPAFLKKAIIAFPAAGNNALSDLRTKADEDAFVALPPSPALRPQARTPGFLMGTRCPGA